MKRSEKVSGRGSRLGESCDSEDIDVEMIRSLSYCTSDVGPRPYTPYGSVSIDAALGSAASAPSAATSSKRQTKTCAGGAGNRSWTPETIAASMRGEVGLAHRWLGSDRQDEKEIGKRFLRRAELDPKEHVPPNS